MNFVHVVMNTDPTSGGSNRYASELSTEEKLQGHNSMLVTPKELHLLYIGIIKKILNKKEKSEYSFDIVNIHFPSSFGTLGWKLLLCKFRKLEVISTFHGPWHKEVLIEGGSKTRQVLAYLTQSIVLQDPMLK